MTDTSTPPPPNPTPTPWAVEASTERVDLHDNRAEVTFTVKNQQSAAQRAVFEIVPGDAVAASWFTIEGERQRLVAPNQSTQYKATIVAPPGTAVASYWFQARVYAADVAPEESSTLSNRVTFAVAQPTQGDGKHFPWWILIVVIAVIAVLGVGGFLLTRPKGPAVVPPVIGQSEAQARSTLEDAGFETIRVVPVHLTVLEPGIAISTDPKDGTEAERDTEIALRITVQLAAPVPTDPGNGQSFPLGGGKVELKWGAVEGAARYRVTIVGPGCSNKTKVEAMPEDSVFTDSLSKASPQDAEKQQKAKAEVAGTFKGRRGGITVCALADERQTFDVPATTASITLENGEKSIDVDWSVAALDELNNVGPSSPTRQFVSKP